MCQIILLKLPDNIHSKQSDTPPPLPSAYENLARKMENHVSCYVWLLITSQQMNIFGDCGITSEVQQRMVFLALFDENLYDNRISSKERPLSNERPPSNKGLPFDNKFLIERPPRMSAPPPPPPGIVILQWVPLV